MARQDIKTLNNDVVIENGDFKIFESDQQHIEDTINAYAGWWKENPTDGVGIGLYQNSSGSVQQLSRKIKIELEKDKYKVDNPIIEFDSSSNLNIYPNATI
jgi:flavorubredoxin